MGEYLISVVSPWEGVDYVRSILLTALEPRFNLHLPAEDPEMSISTAVEEGIEAFMEENPPPTENLSQTVSLVGHMQYANVVAIAGGDDFSLALVGDGPPAGRALLVSPRRNAEGFSVSLPTQSGRVYRLEYKSSLADANWIALPLVAGNGAVRQLTDPTASGAQRFYRVRRW